MAPIPLHINFSMALSWERGVSVPRVVLVVGLLVGMLIEEEVVAVEDALEGLQSSASLNSIFSAIPPHFSLNRLFRHVMDGSTWAAIKMQGAVNSRKIHVTRNSNLLKGKGPFWTRCIRAQSIMNHNNKWSIKNVTGSQRNRKNNAQAQATPWMTLSDMGSKIIRFGHMA